MRQHRHPARAPDPAHRLIQAGPALRHVAGLAGYQPVVEHLALAGAQPQRHQVPAKMAARDQCRVAHVLQRPFPGIGHPAAFQLGRHLARPLGTPRPIGFQPGQQRRILRIHPQAHNMDGLARPGDRHLHPRNQHQPLGPGRRLRLGQAIQHVMVGQRQHVHPVGTGTLHQRGGRKRAVGTGGVAVEVDVEVIGGHETDCCTRTPLDGWPTTTADCKWALRGLNHPASPSITQHHPASPSARALKGKS